MKPVMERLGSALVPWVDRAEPLIRQWEKTLQDQDLARFLQTYMLIQTNHPLDSATASLLFFLPNLTPGLVDEKRNLTRFCIGVNIQPQTALPCPSWRIGSTPPCACWGAPPGWK